MTLIKPKLKDAAFLEDVKKAELRGILVRPNQLIENE